MALGRKSSDRRSGALLDTPKDPDSPVRLDDVLDTLAGVLRVYAQQSFDLENLTSEQIMALCDVWARHALVGSPINPVEHDPSEDDELPKPLAVGDRQWRELRRLFGELRRDESKYVTTTIEDLRRIIWSFMRAIAGAVSEDRRDDASLSAQIEQLSAAMQSNSTDGLMRATSSTVEIIQSLLARRRRRYDEQVANLGAELEILQSELKEARRRMALDPLTHVYNRAAFDEEIIRVADYSSLAGQAAFLLMIDVDDFKKVNDSYGHPTGDAALKSLADSIFRSFPRKTDFVARYGGEEFAVVIRDVSIDDARTMGERLLEVVRQLRIDSESGRLQITISIGLAQLHLAEEPSAWVKRADDALYRAKHEGRDRLVIAAS